MARKKKVRRKGRKKRPSRAKKSRTHVFDVTGIPVRELRSTPLGRRIVELANRNLPEDIALVEDELLDRFRSGES